MCVKKIEIFMKKFPNKTNLIKFSSNNNMMKRFTLVFFIIMLFSSAFAVDYGIWLHSIDIDVETDGSAVVSERFHIFFPTEEDQLEFRQLSINYGSNLGQWQELDPTFKSNIGGNKAVNKKINYSEADDSYLQIDYELIDPLMAKGKETSLVEEYSIKASYLNNLYDSGLWVIPDNTIMTITLPAGAEVKDNIQPQAEVGNIGSRKIITLNGYKSSNELRVSYFIWKKIDPIIDINKFTNFIFRTQEGLVILLGFAVIIGIILYKRKIIINKIENFVEENTVIEED
jgi:hypothetical protein